MASVSWQYPEDQLIALRQQNATAEAAAPIATGVDPQWLDRELVRCGIPDSVARARESTWRFGFFGSLHSVWSA